MDKIDTAIEFYRNFPILKDISKDVLINLSTKTVYKSIPSKQLVVT